MKHVTLRRALTLLAYAAMALLVLAFFTGHGAFVYETF